MAVCNVCLGPLATEPHVNSLSSTFDCSRCGRFTLMGTAANVVGSLSQHRRAMLSHRLRCQQAPDRSPPQIFETDFSVLDLDAPLPTPVEQIDRLVTWVGDHQASVSESASATPAELSAWIGAAITPRDLTAGLSWILRQRDLLDLIEYADNGRGGFTLGLKMSGWNRYEANKRSQIETSTAFMAMQFDPDLIRIVENHFKPAVARAGFELRLLTDSQPAGLIDDQLRVALRTARFVVADLTHANNGAYWRPALPKGLVDQ
jgi:hypothetical protein